MPTDMREQAPAAPLWPGGPLYGGDSVGSDSLALAALAGELRAERACDLGCGAGLLLLLLAWDRPALEVDGIELRPEAAALCSRNIEMNGLSARCAVYTGDLREHILPAGAYKLVVSNPPYFTGVGGAPSPDPARALMRRESATLPELCGAAARLLTPGGAFCLVHRSQRLTDVLCALREAGLEPKRLRFFAHGPEEAPTLFLCEARRGARPGLTALPPLLQTDGTGRETPEYRKICHWEA